MSDIQYMAQPYLHIIKISLNLKFEWKVKMLTAVIEGFFPSPAGG